MRPTRALAPVAAALLLLAAACGGADEQAATAESPAATPAPAASAGGQASVRDDESQQDVVKVAAGSKDHTTLVAAVQAADLVNALSNAGPFTVFAPTNAAFDKLPKGTVEELLEPENKAKLAGILQHHVAVPAIEEGSLTDGMSIGMVEGGPVTISKRGDATYVGDAKILASVRASNGVVYVIDGVLLPATK